MLHLAPAVLEVHLCLFLSLAVLTSFLRQTQHLLCGHFISSPISVSAEVLRSCTWNRGVTPGLESHLECPLLWISPLLAGVKPDHGRKPPLQGPWCWFFPSHPAASISLLLSGSSCTWNGRPELFHSPASSTANPSELGMGTKLTLQQQMGPSSPSHFLSPMCCSLLLRGREGEHFSLPQCVQPLLASLPVLARLWLLSPSL